MRRVAFASAIVATLAAVASAGCTFNGNAFNIPTTTLPIAQSVPENPGLDGMRQWQLALCTPAAYSGCPSTPASYVIEMNGNGDGCVVGFNTATTEAWVSNYGGAQNTFTGTAAMSNDRVANVTLICDPSATTPTNDGNVIAYSSSGGTVWNFNIRIKTNQVCGGNPPPVPTPQPAGPPFTPAPTLPPSPAGQGTATFLVCTDPQCNSCLPADPVPAATCVQTTPATSQMVNCTASYATVTKYSASPACERASPSATSVYYKDTCYKRTAGAMQFVACASN